MQARLQRRLAEPWFSRPGKEDPAACRRRASTSRSSSWENSGRPSSAARSKTPESSKPLRPSSWTVRTRISVQILADQGGAVAGFVQRRRESGLLVAELVEPLEAAGRREVRERSAACSPSSIFPGRNDRQHDVGGPAGLPMQDEPRRRRLLWSARVPYV